MMKLESVQLNPLIGVANDTYWLDKIRRDLESKGDYPNIELSVVIPYFERPETLKQTLYSITRSSYNLSQVEILIADDGSRESLKPNLQEFLDMGLNIKYLWHADKGYRLSAVRNFGVRSASYENIIILDCDLAVSSEFFLEHAWTLFISKKVISIGLRDNRKVDSNRRVLDFAEKDPSKIGSPNSEDWRLGAWINKVPNYTISNECWRLCSGGNIGFHRSLLGEDFFSEEFDFWGGEDLEWAYRMFKKGAYFQINDKAKAYHFECQKEEYQVDRKAEKSKKEKLVSSLVPVYKNSECKEGKIPYISVIMPCFNKADYIKDALKSLKKATKYRYEVIVVDDGSTDNLSEVIESLDQGLKKNLVFYERSHKGVEQTYTDCLDLCKGEFIAQLDADDLLLDNAIDVLIESLLKSPCDLAYGRYHKFKNKDVRKWEKGWEFPICDRFKSIFEGMHTHPLRVFRKRALLRSGSFRNLGLKASVDFSLYSQILTSCYGFFVEKDTYLYRQIESSISHSRKEYQDKNTRNVIEDNVRRCSNNSDFEINEYATKKFEIKIPIGSKIDYLEHLGLNLEIDYISSNPREYIHPYFRNIDVDHNKVEVRIEDALTKMTFDVVLNLEDFLDYRKKVSNSKDLEYCTLISKKYTLPSK